MSSYKRFQEVPVWEKAHQLVLKVYLISKNFPKEEQYGLTSQIKRFFSSIAANIAERFFKNTTKELIQFLYNARGSCGETICHLILTKNLGYMNGKAFSELEEECEEVAK